MRFEVRRITTGPKHHLFGFHDLVQTNARGNFLLSLEVDDISRPPLPGETCSSGVVVDGEFQFVHRTHTWNYPQGARQQWIGESDLFSCNDRNSKGELISIVSDASEMRVVDTLPFPIHCIDAKSSRAFYINYDRLYSAGVYGYVPLRKCGSVKLVDMPGDDGLWVGDLKTGKRDLLVSILAVARCGEAQAVRTGYPHYLTHLMLNPSGTRLAFLHRYRVPDGGEITRLMTMATDGTGLRCLAKGFLSHFTWTGDDRIFIWGSHQPSLCALREASYLRLPGVLQGALVLKKCMRMLRALRAGTRSVPATATRRQDKSFLLLKDSDAVEIAKCGVGILLEDGHPMACPRDLNLLINDTYPDEAGDRILMQYDIRTGTRSDIGRFRRIFESPDVSKFDVDSVMSGTDPRIRSKIERDAYLFARSGYHCDLHPRWSFDGKVAYFDSIHEGTRQIYEVQS